MTDSSKVWQNPIYFFAFGFGTGLLPYAPGTWGTLAGIPVFLLFASTTPAIYLLLTLVAFLFGVYVCEKVSKDIGEHDYPGIVWDEVVGFLITMWQVPVDLHWIIVGFILFRIFDIWKPYPIRWFDTNVKGGLGIMLDDVMAAIPAWLILQALLLCFTR